MRQLIVLVLFVLTNCKVAVAQSLSGSKWTLSSIDNLDTGISKNIGATAKATVSFESDSLFSGKFCNAFSGKYRAAKDNGIRFSTPSRTKMMCLGLDKYEAELMALLPQAHKYRIDKETLFIFTTAHKRITFKKAG